jgi:hypothetical protein
VVRLAAGLGAKMSGFPSFSFWASQSFLVFVAADGRISDTKKAVCFQRPSTDR